MGVVQKIGLTHRPEARRGDGADEPRSRTAADRQGAVLGGAAAVLRRLDQRPADACSRAPTSICCRPARAASRSAISSAWKIRRCCNRTFRAGPSCCRPSASGRSTSARRSCSATWKWARSSAGTSARWRGTSPSMPSCARRSTSTCMTTRASGTPPARRWSSVPTGCSFRSNRCARWCWAASRSKRPTIRQFTEESPADHAFTLYRDQGRGGRLGLQAQRAVRRQFHQFGLRSGGRIAGHPARPEDRRGLQRLAGLRPRAG